MQYGDPLVIKDGGKYIYRCIPLWAVQLHNINAKHHCFLLSWITVDTILEIDMMKYVKISHLSAPSLNGIHAEKMRDEWHTRCPAVIETVGQDLVERDCTQRLQLQSRSGINNSALRFQQLYPSKRHVRVVNQPGAKYERKDTTINRT